MNSSQLFFEDNKVGKKHWIVLITMLIVCFIGWTLALILSFIVPAPEGYKPNNFQDNALDNIISILFLCIMFIFIIALFIYRYKSKRFQQTITITKNQFIFVNFKSNKDIFNTNELIAYEVIRRNGNMAKIKLSFLNNEIIIRTRKYENLQPILSNIMEENKSLQKQ